LSVGLESAKSARQDPTTERGTGRAADLIQWQGNAMVIADRKCSGLKDSGGVYQKKYKRYGHLLKRGDEGGYPNPPSDSVAVDFPPMGDSENQDIGAEDGIYHTVVADAMLAQAGELTFQRRIGFRLPGQILVNGIEDCCGFGFGEIFEVALH
jgi:hypothetical protein